MQTYELPTTSPSSMQTCIVWRGSSELAELGFDDLPEEAVVLLEWPDRAADLLPADRLDIAFTLSPQHGDTFRNVRITGYGTFAARARTHGGDPQFSRRERICRSRAAARCRAMPRPVSMSG